MGFMAKSVFWLGLVYSAMPFDSGSQIALAPTASAAPPWASLSLGSLAGDVIPIPRPNQDDLKSAVQIAATLCRRDCFSPLTRTVELDRCSGPERPGGANAAPLPGENRRARRCSTARG